MIEGYEEIMAHWATGLSTTSTVTVESPEQEGEEVIVEIGGTVPRGNCCPPIEITPGEEFHRWAVQQVVTMLANSDYYYTKYEVDSLLRQITENAVTREQVEEMIAVAIAGKANQADLEALSAQVASNTEKILNTYTKQETNALLTAYLTKLQATDMFGNYSKVEDTTLILNADNIGITI